MNRERSVRAWEFYRESLERPRDDPRLMDAFMAGYEAALTPPQPVADWRERCVVEKCSDGDWDVVSLCGKFWLARTGWFPFTLRGKRRFTAGYFLGGEASARAALAACPTPPPGVSQ